MSSENKHVVEEVCVCGVSGGPSRPAPWISRVFDAMGLVFIAAAIVLFLAAWFTAETKFYIALFMSLLISGLLYTAIGEILRSCAETAANTAKLVQLKEVEITEKMQP